MFATKNVLAAAIMLFNDEILNEDEMFCVFSELNRKNPPFLYWNYDRIEKQMDDMSSAEIKSKFRFGHSELPLLAEAVQIPQYFVCRIMLFNDEILNEDEMFCVFSKLNRKNPPFPYCNYDRIEKQMDDLSSVEIKSELRFGHSELPLLAEAVQIPQYFVCSNGTVASGMEGHIRVA